MKTLTKLYPGADCSYRDIIDLLQVVLYVTLGHSVQTCPEATEKEKKKNTQIGKKREKKTGVMQGIQQNCSHGVRSGLNVCVGRKGVREDV